MRRSILAAVAASLMVCGLGATSVAAAPQPDGAYSVLAAGTYGRGLVFVGYQGTTTVNAGVLGLLGSAEYFVVGRSIGCNGTPAMSNRMFRVTGTADANGFLWIDQGNVSIGGSVKSIWVGPSNGNAPTVCGVSFNFQTMDLHDVAGADTSLGIWDKEHVLSLLQKRPDGRARLTLTIDSGSGDDTFNFVGTDTRCGTAIDHKFFDIPAELAVTGTYKSRTVQLTENQFDRLRSVRVRDGNGMKIGCYPVIMANTEGD